MHATGDGETTACGLRERCGWLLGPALLMLTLLLPPPDGLSVEAWRTAGVACLMAVFWIAETLPIPVTALLPLVLFPILGLGDIKATAAPFANPVIFLFLGGFLIALAMQRWNLHRRVAITLVARIGTRPSAIVAGFLLASALISMWVSNTATAATFLPIGGALAISLGQNPLLFMIPIALAANCSFMLPVGTPPNAIVYGSVLISLPQMARAGMLLNILAVPVVVLLLWLLGPHIFGIEINLLPDWAP